LCTLVASGGKAAEHAFAELYDRYAARIHAYCYRILNGSEDVEDVFQETFMRFHKVIRRGQQMTNVSGFLFKSAKHLCLDVLKSGERRTMVPAHEEELLSRDVAYEKTEMLQLIATALDTLEFEFREAFILREYNGLSYAEVADVCGVSVATAKIRVFRAKQKIKKILDPYLRDLLKV
jgi:RNA polymerase sigma-70 factor (ECF subfamily)